ncbi:MAG: FtsB family cell division protein [Acidimicrobiales bacterium]
MRRSLVVLAAALALAAAVLFGSFPAATWFHQRAELASSESQLGRLQHQDQALADQAARLRTDSAIEHLARQRYGLVPKGSRAYVVLPSPSKP